jgi:hypothetical protein
MGYLPPNTANGNYSPPAPLKGGKNQDNAGDFGSTNMIPIAIWIYGSWGKE